MVPRLKRLRCLHKKTFILFHQNSAFVSAGDSSGSAIDCHDILLLRVDQKRSDYTQIFYCWFFSSDITASPAAQPFIFLYKARGQNCNPGTLMVDLYYYQGLPGGFQIFIWKDNSNWSIHSFNAEPHLHFLALRLVSIVTKLKVCKEICDISS